MEMEHILLVVIVSCVIDGVFVCLMRAIENDYRSSCDVMCAENDNV